MTPPWSTSARIARLTLLTSRARGKVTLMVLYGTSDWLLVQKLSGVVLRGHQRWDCLLYDNKTYSNHKRPSFIFQASQGEISPLRESVQSAVTFDLPQGAAKQLAPDASTFRSVLLHAVSTHS